uniref:Uncharacterized protein n=1 Tax=Plectus sambesii TaxID=2011161 RepID=A0A914VJD0_9BILA
MRSATCRLASVVLLMLTASTAFCRPMDLSFQHGFHGLDDMPMPLPGFDSMDNVGLASNEFVSSPFSQARVVPSRLFSRKFDASLTPNLRRLKQHERAWFQPHFVQPLSDSLQR